MEIVGNAVKVSRPAGFGPEWAAEVFGAHCLSEAACRRLVLDRLHPTGARCPACGMDLSGKKAARFFEGARVRCSCGKYFTAQTGTVLSGCALDYRELVLMAYLIGAGFSDSQVAERVGVDRTTVWSWRKRFDA